MLKMRAPTATVLDSLPNETMKLMAVLLNISCDGLLEASPLISRMCLMYILMENFG